MTNRTTDGIPAQGQLYRSGNSLQRTAPGIDWDNTSYDITCDGIAPDRFTVQLRDKAGSISGSEAGTEEDRYDVLLAATSTGDATGDDVPETALLLSCAPQPSNFYVQDVQIFSSSGERIAELPSTSTLDPGSVLPPQYIPDEFDITEGTLATGLGFYEPGDSHASGPSVHRAITWRWTGQEFEASG